MSLSIRVFLPFSLAALSVFAFQRFRAETVQASSTPLDTCFSEAAGKWRVSESLLRVIAQEESGGFHNIPSSHTEDEGTGHRHMKVYGVMGLRDDAVLGRSLHRAAEASGIPVPRIIESPCANIEGAAALLSRELKRRNGDLTGVLLELWNFRSLKDGKDALSEIVRLAKKGSQTGRIRFAPNSALVEPLSAALQASRLEACTGGGCAPLARGGAEYGEADWHPSPNFRGGNQPAYIVMHTTEGGFAGSVSWLSSPKSGVSAHYVIRKSDGYIKQLVHEENVAFHARCWNPVTIGIEQEGFSNDPDTFTDALLGAGSRLVSHLAGKHGISVDGLHIIGHNFGQSGKINQTDLQNCNDHGDPGRYFPWDDFLRLAGGEGQVRPGPAPRPRPSPPPRPRPTPDPEEEGDDDSGDDESGDDDSGEDERRR